jgi:hypothetical protein
MACCAHWRLPTERWARRRQGYDVQVVKLPRYGSEVYDKRRCVLSFILQSRDQVYDSVRVFPTIDEIAEYLLAPRSVSLFYKEFPCFGLQLYVIRRYTGLER